MDISTIVNPLQAFRKFTGEVVADLKSRDIATIDIELLNLKRAALAEVWEDCQSRVATAAEQDKARAEQDLITRGLGNTTIRPSIMRTIEQDLTDQLDNATRDYNRKLEELALLERKIIVQARPCWKSLWRCGSRLWK